MFDPLEARDTHGKWVRMGRGDLEQVLHALAKPRAEHIAEVNGKAGDAAHIKRVQADIRNKLLRGLPAAGTYHVRITKGERYTRVDVHTPGAGGMAHHAVIIPDRKSAGNVEAPQIRQGAPNEGDIVGKAEFGQEKAPGTRTIRERLQEAVAGSQGREIKMTGLTDIAKQAAAKGRPQGGTSPTEKLGRRIEGLRAQGKITPKEERLAKEALANRRRRVGEGDDVHLAGAIRHQRRGERQRAVIKVRQLLQEGSQPVERGEIRGDAVQAAQAKIGNADNAALDRIRNDRLTRYLVEWRDDGKIRREDQYLIQALMLDHQRQPGMSTDTYLRYLHLNARSDLARQAVSKALDLRAAKREARLPARKGTHVPGRGAERPKASLLVKVPEQQHGSPLEHEMANGEIRLLDQRGGAGINTTKHGQLAGSGQRVLIKPAAGAVGGPDNGFINTLGGRRVRDEVPLGRDAERERAAYLLGKQLEPRLAPVVIRDVPGLGKASVQAAVGNADAAVGGIPRNPAAQEDLRRMALLDAVIGNLDRHHGNMRLQTGGHEGTRVIPIDHGLAFPEDKGMGLGNHQAFNRHQGEPLRPDEVQALEKLRDNGLLWQQIRQEGLLPEAALKLTENRIDAMIRRSKFLSNQREVTGDIAKTLQRGAA